MTRKQIQSMQEKIGAVPDGFWGPDSIKKCQQHLRAMAIRTPNPFPAADEKSLQAFYGAPGDMDQMMDLSVKGLGVQYDGRTVNSITCHRLIGKYLYWILESLSNSFPYILKEYAGCFVNRPMRGGTKPSLHARGAAIDFSPAKNGNRVAWPVAAQMPLEIMEVFAAASWLPAGAFWLRDSMHFQATK
jgi:hypothetical protein